jgi:DNA processing protein
MTDNDGTLEALAILQLPGVGPATARKILAVRENTSISASIAKFLPALNESDWKIALVDAQQIIDRSRELDIRTIGINSSLYPPRLKLISDPPVVIYVKGSVEVLAKDGIAVVGTRNVSTTGARLATLIAGFVAKRGYVVVSGLAIGIDALAHEAALDECTLTVAVMAHGLDMISPASHKKLAERILASGGALMSEHPVGFPARPPEFVRRNRLQSGLSLGSIIVESGLEGGSMHQARFTKSQGRLLMTVLAQSDQSRGDLKESGARELIEKLGAVPLRTTGDLGKALDLLKNRHIAESPPQGQLF